jgi:hypothetical protein
MNPLEKEITVPYRPDWSGWNLSKALALTFTGGLIFSKGNYWFGLVFLVGLYRAFKSIHPTARKLIIKNGFAWPEHLREQTTEENKILSIKKVKSVLFIYTERKTFKVLLKKVNQEHADQLAAIQAFYEQKETFYNFDLEATE